MFFKRPLISCSVIDIIYACISRLLGGNLEPLNTQGFVTFIVISFSQLERPPWPSPFEHNQLAFPIKHKLGVPALYSGSSPRSSTMQEKSNNAASESFRRGDSFAHMPTGSELDRGGSYLYVKPHKKTLARKLWGISEQDYRREFVLDEDPPPQPVCCCRCCTCCTTISPDSNFRVSWDLAVMVLVIWTVLSIPVRFSFFNQSIAEGW